MRVTVAARALAAACALLAAAPGGEVGDYALRVPLRTAPGGGVQRVTLPAAVLAALREGDGGDLRVLDGRGRAMPIARADPAAPIRRERLDVAPLLGAGDGRGSARVSVRLDDEGRARVAEVEGAGPPDDGAVATGALLDARAIRGRAERLELDLDLPAGQPVRVAVAASGDLDGWRRLGERVVFRAPGAVARPVAIPLGAALDAEWLRLTWRAEGRLLGPVSVRGAVLVARGPGGEVTIDATPPPLPDARAVEFANPFAIPAATLRVVTRGDEGATPVRVLGRDGTEERWAVLGRGIASRDAPPIALDGGKGTMRVEADARTPGFAAPPTLRFGFAPRGVAFAASGPGPFTLVAGRAGAGAAFLPLLDLTGGAGLREASAEVRDAGPLALAAPDRAGEVRRQALLWAVLLGATALLGGMAWLLWRQGGAAGEA